jgi:hypothetical protein
MNREANTASNLKRESWIMKFIRSLSTVLVAVFLASAIVVSSASAIPKFRLPITNRGFTVLGGLSILRTQSARETIDCDSDIGTGTILSDDEIKVKVHFLNCKAYINNRGPCTIHSPGAPVGLILTELLTGLLGLLHEPNGAAGILIEPRGSHVFAAFASIESSAECEAEPETDVEGTVAAEFEPTGKLQTLGTVRFLPLSATGKQKITLILTLNGVVKPKLTSFGGVFIESTVESVDVVHAEEAVEIS